MDKKKTVYIDGDIFVYSVGHAGQDVSYVVHGKVTSAAYSTMKSAKASSMYTGDNIEKVISPSPLANVLHSMKLQIDNVVTKTSATDYVVYLTGTGNFRDDVTTDYKATRVKVDRPIYYEELRTYLIDVHNAIVVDGCEADDALGISATLDTEPCCIASTDKDLNTIRGEHYNWQKDCLYNVTPEDATLWFWCQMIMGDSTDNIKGIPKKGKMAAYKLLVDIQDSPINIFNRVTEEYIKYCDDDENKGKAMRDMNARLLWILNNDADLWNAHNPTGELFRTDKTRSTNMSMEELNAAVRILAGGVLP